MIMFWARAASCHSQSEHALTMISAMEHCGKNGKTVLVESFAVVIRFEHCLHRGLIQLTVTWIVRVVHIFLLSLNWFRTLGNSSHLAVATSRDVSKVLRCKFPCRTASSVSCCSHLLASCPW